RSRKTEKGPTGPLCSDVWLRAGVTDSRSRPRSSHRRPMASAPPSRPWSGRSSRRRPTGPARRRRWRSPGRPRPSPAPGRAARRSRRRPDSGTRRSARRLLAAPLDVALHELLGVLLEDVVDLVEDLVELLLDLLALLLELGVRLGVLALRRTLRPLYLLLLLVGHGYLLSVPGSHLRQDDALLRLVLPLPVRVGDGAGLVGLEEEDLGDALVGVDLGRQRRRVRDLEGDEALPLRLERGHVGDDPAPRVGRLPQADRDDVAGDAEVLDGPPEGEGVGRDDAHVALAI